MFASLGGVESSVLNRRNYRFVQRYFVVSSLQKCHFEWFTTMGTRITDVTPVIPRLLRPVRPKVQSQQSFCSLHKSRLNWTPFVWHTILLLCDRIMNGSFVLYPTTVVIVLIEPRTRNSPSLIHWFAISQITEPHSGSAGVSPAAISHTLCVYFHGGAAEGVSQVVVWEKTRM